MKQLILIITLLTTIISTTKAAWQIPVTNYSRETYGAGRQNWAIAERADGWIYVANEYGLVEYDGARWSLYGLNNSSSPRSVKVTESGDIYCGGANEFGVFRSNGLGGLEYDNLSKLMPDADRDFGDVWGIETLGGKVYFMTLDAVMSYSASDSVTTRSESPARTIAMAVVGDTLFVARADGLFRLTDSKQWSKVKGSDIMAAGDIKGLRKMDDGRLLACTASAGLWTYERGEVKRFATDIDEYVRHNMPFSLAVDDRHIAVGTVAGGVAITGVDGRGAQMVSVANGLQNNTALSVAFDKGGNLWCGLDLGISEINIASPLRQLYSTTNRYGSGYAWIAAGDKMYLGTNRGLFASPYPTGAGEFSATFIGGSIGQVWGLGQIGDAVVCCHDKGLFQVMKDGTLKAVMKDDGIWQVRRLDEKMAIAGGYRGLYVVGEIDGNVVVLKKIEGAPTKAKTFEIDAQGRIWICTDRGVERLTLSQDMSRCAREVMEVKPQDPTQYSNVIRLGDQIIVSVGERSRTTDANGELTDANGLLDQMDGSGVFYTCATRDTDGNIWYIVRNSLKIRKFDKEKGAQEEKSRTVWDLPWLYIYGYTQITPIGGTRAIINCVQGFAMADVNNTMAKDSALVFIRRLASITPGEEETIWGYTYQGKETHPEIAYRQNSIRISYGCAQQGCANNKYSCRLRRNGAGEYTEWDSAMEKEYTYLSPGEYEFTVATRIGDGEPTGQATLRFTILPPWYLTWWAWAAYVIAFIGGVIGIVILVKRHNKRSRARLTQQKEEEMRLREEQFAKEALARDKEILLLRNEKMEELLKSKSMELSAVMLGTIDRNDLILRTKRDLSQIQQDLKDGDAAAAQKRLAKMQSKLTEDSDTRVDWRRFEENFDAVNGSFLKKVQKRFPWISENEKRLCVYIVMNLMNKEIAPLMNISIRGVEMLRYRMRKKMELEREDDLQSLLRSIRDEA